MGGGHRMSAPCRGWLGKPAARFGRHAVVRVCVCVLVSACVKLKAPASLEEVGVVGVQGHPGATLEHGTQEFARTTRLCKSHTSHPPCPPWSPGPPACRPPPLLFCWPPSCAHSTLHTGGRSIQCVSGCCTLCLALPWSPADPCPQKQGGHVCAHAACPRCEPPPPPPFATLPPLPFQGKAGRRGRVQEADDRQRPGPPLVTDPQEHRWTPLLPAAVLEPGPASVCQSINQSIDQSISLPNSQGS